MVEGRPPAILTTRVMDSHPETIFTYLIVESPQNPRVLSLSKLITK